MRAYIGPADFRKIGKVYKEKRKFKFENSMILSRMILCMPPLPVWEGLEVWLFLAMP